MLCGLKLHYQCVQINVIIYFIGYPKEIFGFEILQHQRFTELQKSSYSRFFSQDGS